MKNDQIKRFVFSSFNMLLWKLERQKFIGMDDVEWYFLIYGNCTFFPFSSSSSSSYFFFSDESYNFSNSSLPFESLIFSSKLITFLFIWLYYSTPPLVMKAENTESLWIRQDWEEAPKGTLAKEKAGLFKKEPFVFQGCCQI